MELSVTVFTQLYHEGLNGPVLFTLCMTCKVLKLADNVRWLAQRLLIAILMTLESTYIS